MKLGLAAAAVVVGGAFVVFALRLIPKRTVTYDLGLVISGDSSTVAEVAGQPIEVED